MTNHRQREPRPPQPDDDPGRSLGRAGRLLDRIGRLARQARETAEDLAGRLLSVASARSVPLVVSEAEPEPAPAPVPVSGIASDVSREPESAPAPVSVSEIASDVGQETDPEPSPGTRVVLVSRDPEWLFCYWDVEPAARSAARVSGSRLTLRLHDVTDIDFDGTNGWSRHLYPLTEEARWWHVPVPHRGRHYVAEVGYCARSGTFRPLARSEAVATLSPDPAPSDEVELATVHLDAPLTDQAPHRPASGAQSEPVGLGVKGPASGSFGPLDRPAAGFQASLPVAGVGDRAQTGGAPLAPSSPSSPSVGAHGAGPSSAAVSHRGSVAVWSRQR